MKLSIVLAIAALVVVLSVSSSEAAPSDAIMLSGSDIAFEGSVVNAFMAPEGEEERGSAGGGGKNKGKGKPDDPGANGRKNKGKGRGKGKGKGRGKATTESSSGGEDPEM